MSWRRLLRRLKRWAALVALPCAILADGVCAVASAFWPDVWGLSWPLTLTFVCLGYGVAVASGWRLNGSANGVGGVAHGAASRNVSEGNLTGNGSAVNSSLASARPLLGGAPGPALVLAVEIRLEMSVASALWGGAKAALALGTAGGALVASSCAWMHGHPLVLAVATWTFIVSSFAWL